MVSLGSAHCILKDSIYKVVRSRQIFLCRHLIHLIGLLYVFVCSTLLNVTQLCLQVQLNRSVWSGKISTIALQQNEPLLSAFQLIIQNISHP